MATSSPRSTRQRSLRLIGGFIFILALVALGFFGAYRNLRGTVETELEEDIGDRVDDVHQELVLTYDLYLDEVQSGMRVLEALAVVQGPPAVGPAVSLNGQIVPDLRFGAAPVAGHFELVDKDVQLMGGTATLFTRVGDGFMRIATNVKRPDGSRAIGTVLDPQGPAIAVVRQGKTFNGVVDILGHSYITGYKPIQDATGATIGLYYVGYPVATLGRIGESLTNSHLLEHGFFALLDQNNKLLFNTHGADAAIIQAALPRAVAGQTTWTDGPWSWQAERFPQWKFTLLAATYRPDVAQQTWHRVIPVFAYLAPFILVAFALVFVFIRRLTATLDTAERLREEGRKLALVVSRSHNGVMITRPDRTIEWVNDGFTRTTGYSAEEAIGRHPDTFLHGPETSAETLEISKQARAENRSFQIDVLNYHKSGRKIWIHADGQPIFDDAGKVVNYTVIQIDITKRKQMEEDLRLAREAAEEASRTKSSFLANMSHELRTPMNAIIGYSEMLMEEAEDTGQEDSIPDLKKIHAAGKHLLGLINDVLDLSKIEAGKTTLYLEDFSIPTMVGEVASTITPLVSKNENELVIVCPPDFGSMRADVTKIRQTLFNLLSNAAKFTQKGRITLTTVRETRDGREWVHFHVADSGIGMTPAQLGKLFQAFVQADASTTRKYGGTGLGLAISRRFCQMMGGDITVTSEVGKGTVFTATLPARVIDPNEVSPVAVAAPTDSPAPAATTPTAGAEAAVPVANGPLVLVVDDDPAVLDLLTRNLSKDGYSVRTAQTGQDALGLARELKPRLITLDVMMPSMDGWSVLTALKADSATRDIPVVMVSIVDDKPLGFALGASDYLTKPVDRGRLTEVLAKHAPPSAGRLALVIDDLPDNRGVLRHGLEREGWTVIEAENGRLGLDLFAARKPDLVLLDLMMPVMDGFEFLRELRYRDDGRKVPVVVITAKELTPAERDTLRASVENVVQKGSTGADNLLTEIREKIIEATKP
jgi:PAS domain S-box-containing protein